MTDRQAAIARGELALADAKRDAERAAKLTAQAEALLRWDEPSEYDAAIAASLATTATAIAAGSLVRLLIAAIEEDS